MLLLGRSIAQRVPSPGTEAYRFYLCVEIQEWCRIVHRWNSSLTEYSQDCRIRTSIKWVTCHVTKWRCLPRGLTLPHRDTEQGEGRGRDGAVNSFALFSWNITCRGKNKKVAEPSPKSAWTVFIETIKPVDPWLVGWDPHNTEFHYSKIRFSSLHTYSSLESFSVCHFIQGLYIFF